MAKYTPMMEQYLGIKAQVTDAFLFFRLGDFYEMFFDDAILASKELGITLTGREGGAEERIPMCGVPYHSAENYIHRLIEKGYKVAICEQVEDPSEAVGIVRREVVRIITPGTLMEGKALGAASNNFIVCIARHSNNSAIAACDLSTGELYVTGTEDSLNHLLDEVNVYSPSEIIGDATLLKSVQSNLDLGTRPVLCTEWSRTDEDLMNKQFSIENRRSLNEACIRSVSMLVCYLDETQKRSLAHITNIRSYESMQFMHLDPFTRRNLELVETVRDRSKKGTLFWILDQTETSMGARMLRRWIDKPLMNQAQLEERYEAIGVLYNDLIIREGMRLQLREIYDLERLVGRICFGNANARDLIALKTSLGQLPGLMGLCEESGSATLHKLAGSMDICSDIKAWIEAAITDEPPVSIRDGGMIRSVYNDRLDQLRDASANGKQWLAELEKQEREITGIKSLKIGYNKVFGYYIEITKSNYNSLPEGRYERKQTLANAERYITPELKEKEALILEAEDKMVDIEYELFIQLRSQIAGEMQRLQRLAEQIALVDVYRSLAAVSAANRFVKPLITEGYELYIEEGRHPVVEAVLNEGSFIANDTRMADQEARMLLITGPNMAGKSTYMRQVALICIMAQMGCFVPARKAVIPLHDRIFTRIGAADDLISGQSTFMMEMRDIQVMTEKATARSFVIIDELGRGTSTAEGMSIAQAVIEFLHDQVGCKTLVSTHFHELAHLQDSLSYLRNYCMAVKESGEQVTFLRKLIEGAASTSYGIYCARIAGLPVAIIDRSYLLLSGYEARETANPAAIADGQVQLSPQRAAVAVQAQAAGLASGWTEAAASSAVQLSMFDDEHSRGARQKKKSELKAELVAEKLKSVDLMNMTPLQAMHFIQELKLKLQD